MPPSFLITTRPDRLVSVEQEVTFGGAYLADALGVQYHGYHNGERSLSQSLRVEEDSSCDSELIYGRWNLGDAAAAAAFADTVETVDRMRAAGEIGYGYRAGLHVHVDVTREPFATLRSLYLVFNHLEDALYRLAAAGYRDHRDHQTGSGYASPTTKGLRRAVELQRWGRSSRGGLNLSNYLAATMNCTCGAIAIGAWDECQCERSGDRRTVEFRLWNATTRPRKVHAYVALSHALVEWAARHQSVNPERLPERPFVGIRHGRPGDSRKALRFILSQLSLSAEERQSILWTARRSTLRSLCGPDHFARIESEFGGATITDEEHAADDTPDMELVGVGAASDEDDEDTYNEPF